MPSSPPKSSPAPPAGVPCHYPHHLLRRDKTQTLSFSSLSLFPLHLREEVVPLLLHYLLHSLVVDRGRGFPLRLQRAHHHAHSGLDRLVLPLHGTDHVQELLLSAPHGLHLGSETGLHHDRRELRGWDLSGRGGDQKSVVWVHLLPNAQTLVALLWADPESAPGVSPCGGRAPLLGAVKVDTDCGREHRQRIAVGVPTRPENIP